MKRLMTAVVLVASIVWTALVWSVTRDDEDDMIVLWHIEASEVVRVRYSGPGIEVSLVPVEKRWQADVQHQPDPANRASTIEAQRFLIDPERQREIEDALSPLRSPRRWVSLDEDRLEAFGLTDASPPSYLTIHDREGQTRTFLLGKEGYGHRSVYAREMGSGEVVMLSGEMVRALRFAQRDLIDRSLHETPIEDLVRLTLTTHGETERALTLVHHNEPEALMRYWSFAERPGRSRIAQRWASGALRLASSAAPLWAEALWEESSSRRLTLKLEREDGHSETLHIKEFEREDKEPVYLARGAHTGDHVVTLYPGPARTVFEALDALFVASTQEVLLAPPRHEPGDGHHHH